MDDMNAKDLLRRKVTEAGSPVPPERSPGGPPPGRQYPPVPGRTRTAPHHALGSETAEMPEEGLPGDVARMTGREPRGQFSPKEASQLKDIVILILASMARSEMDMRIGQALMTGQEIEPGLLQHIIDEARNVQVPESHNAVLQKIFMKLQQ